MIDEKKMVELYKKGKEYCKEDGDCTYCVFSPHNDSHICLHRILSFELVHFGTASGATMETVERNIVGMTKALSVAEGVEVYGDEDD